MLMMNHTMIEQVTEKRNMFKHNSLELLVGIICTVKIVYGWAAIKENTIIYIVNTFIVYLCAGIYLFFKDTLYKLNSNKILYINNVLKEKEIFNELQNEFQQIFESLEEGIIVVKNDKVSFTNDMFHELYRFRSRDKDKTSIDHRNEAYMDLKIFKVLRDDFANQIFDSVPELSKGTKKNKKKTICMPQDSQGLLYSIRDLIQKPPSFFKDKFFFIDCPTDSKQKFKYVHIKMKQLNSLTNTKMSGKETNKTVL